MILARNLSPKSAITVSGSGSFVDVSGGQQIPLTVEVTNIGDNFSLLNNKIIVSGNVSQIKVSAHSVGGYASSAGGRNYIYLAIRKNNERIITTSANVGTTYGSAEFPVTIFNVQSGDQIYLEAIESAHLNLGQTFLTVQQAN